MIGPKQSQSASTLRLTAAWFFSLGIMSLAAFRIPLRSLIELALRDDRYTYSLLVPLISTFLIWLKREHILHESTRTPRRGPLLLMAGILLLCGVFFPRLRIGADGGLRAGIPAMILVWVAIAFLCYGVRALRAALFPLLFLVLMIPIPASIMDQLVVTLQQGSAEVTAALFKISGMPFSRDGMSFSLPIGYIEVGTECSGIRSAAALFISGILAGYLFLRSGWLRAGFALLTIPVVIFKNAFRIATISWLAVHVDPGFMEGNLHHRGGLVFSPLAVALLLPVLMGLRKMEEHPDRSSVTRQARRNNRGA